ncbi:MAG: glycosyltransferase family A protein [Ferruginibacter sp.]
MSKKVTVVIPCYNQGIFLMDALKSLQTCDNNLFDLIIVNDGSIEKETKIILKRLSDEGFNVFNQENKGLGEARNTGIRLSKTDYVLPLDADNKILPIYLTKAIHILNTQPEIAVVYGNAKLFGEETGALTPGPFNLQQLMICNYIDACAVIRKSAIEAVGLYDNMKIMGYEDWDLWLRFAFGGYQFYYLDETLFEYRVRENSMLRSLNQNIQRQNEIEDYFSKKYADKLDFEFVVNRLLYQFKKRPFRFLHYLLMKKFFPNHFQKLVKQNKIYKNFIYG